MRRACAVASAAAVVVVSGSAGLAAGAPPEPTEQRANCAVAITAASTAAPAGHRLLNVAAAHRFSTGTGVKVAVIDTGVAPHPRLPRLIAGGDYVGDGDGLADCDAHGTLVAGIIAGRPSADDDFVGVAPDATIIAVRQSSGAFSTKGRGRDGAVVGAGYGPIETLATAIDRAVELGAGVINISEVACTAASDHSGDRVLGAALTRAKERDAVVVVAAGNLTETAGCRDQNPSGAATAQQAWAQLRTSVTPARLAPLVLAVGAVDAAGAPAEFSLRGPWVGVAAPGTEVVSLAPGPGGTRLVGGLRTTDGAVPLAGTSYAAPYVAGLAALLRARYPQLSATQVIERIIGSAHGGGHDAAVGSGVVDLVAALSGEPAPTAAAADLRFTPPADETAPNAGLRAIGVGLALGAVCIAGVSALFARVAARAGGRR